MCEMCVSRPEKTQTPSNGLESLCVFLAFTRIEGMRANQGVGRPHLEGFVMKTCHNYSFLFGAIVFLTAIWFAVTTMSRHTFLAPHHMCHRFIFVSNLAMSGNFDFAHHTCCDSHSLPSVRRANYGTNQACPSGGRLVQNIA
jgi:hypothetical protein